MQSFSEDIHLRHCVKWQTECVRCNLTSSIQRTMIQYISSLVKLSKGQYTFGIVHPTEYSGELFVWETMSNVKVSVSDATCRALSNAPWFNIRRIWRYLLRWLIIPTIFIILTIKATYMWIEGVCEGDPFILTLLYR